MGCRISPNAMLVIKNDEVDIISLAGKGSLEKIMNMIPEIVGKMDFHKHREEGDATE